MEQKKIGIAIIGAGAIADVHIKAYTQYPELCEVRAVCDLFPEKAEQLIQSNGLTAAKAYKDYKEAIASGCIDAVSICLPPQMHADIGRYAASLGIERILCVGKESLHMYRAAKSVAPDCAEYFETQDALLVSLHALVAQGDVILVKASRGMYLEKTVEFLLSLGNA